LPAAAVGSGGSSGAPQAVVPFLAGSYEYTEPMFTDVVTPGVNAVENLHNITPGGFLRGVYLELTSTGGSLGTGVLNPDAPWSIISSVSLESIDGTPILYPMSGYQAYLFSRFTRTWDGDPGTDPAFSASVNPAFRLRFFVESRMSLGCLPNTDARAQYRFRYTVNAFNPGIVTTTGSATAPSCTFKGYLETWAQPPATDLAGNPIAQIPDGLAVQRFTSRQANLPTVSGIMTVQSNRVGNLIRTIILEFRDNTPGYALRTDLTGDPLRLRLDNTQLASYNRTRLDYDMDAFYNLDAPSMPTRPTGVYVLHRWHDPGSMTGPYWLPTTEASYLTFEINGGPSGGSVSILTEDLAPVGPIPNYLMGL
jgi:hypothetical protein